MCCIWVCVRLSRSTIFAHLHAFAFLCSHLIMIVVKRRELTIQVLLIADVSETHYEWHHVVAVHSFICCRALPNNSSGECLCSGICCSFSMPDTAITDSAINYLVHWSPSNLDEMKTHCTVQGNQLHKRDAEEPSFSCSSWQSSSGLFILRILHIKCYQEMLSNVRSQDCLISRILPTMHKLSWPYKACMWWHKHLWRW